MSRLRHGAIIACVSTFFDGILYLVISDLISFLTVSFCAVVNDQSLNGHKTSIHMLHEFRFTSDHRLLSPACHNISSSVLNLIISPYHHIR